MIDKNQLARESGSTLDASGAELGIERVTTAAGHAFNEADDSYRRRLLAELVGAEAADAVAPRPAESVPDWQLNLNADGLRTDGPTLAEWKARGYKAEGYPPHGYASKEIGAPSFEPYADVDTAEKIAAAKAAREQKEAADAAAKAAAEEQARKDKEAADAAHLAQLQERRKALEDQIAAEQAAANAGASEQKLP